MTDSGGSPLRGKDALAESIRLGHEAADGISKILRKPQDLEYEKTFMPFILLSKKRYVGNKYEEDTENYKQTSMGIVLKRRDNATILKVIYGGVIDIILGTNNINQSIDFLRKSLRDLIRGKYGLDKLVITKTLGDNYKMPEMIAHKVLADRIGEREPGNKPQLFDRIPYVFIQTDEPVSLQGDRIEHPDYIKRMGLHPDYHYYVTNQIMKPISQIYALCIEKLPNFRKGQTYFQEQAKSYRLKGWAEDKIEKKILQLKGKEAELLLFHDTIRQCENQKARAQEITKWFGKK
jgi:DNA polymerase elongation subunit (family B)